MRGESDRVRCADAWDSHAVPAAAGGVRSQKRSLQPPTPTRRGSRLRLVVAIIGLPGGVLIDTPGVPSMALNGVVRREKAHA
jgi:hypothetical protein